MHDFARSAALVLVLLNPFLIIIYLLDVVQKLDFRRFTSTLVRAALLASAVFCCFALLGDAVFSEVVQAEFASFQIFGGVIFLLIGIQFVFRGPTAIEMLRGDSKHLVGSIAVPVLVGPGTISASVIVGKRLEPAVACVAVCSAVCISILIMLLLKLVHDYIRPKNDTIVQRYIEIMGRIIALYVGTVSVQMIMEGVRTWAAKF